MCLFLVFSMRPANKLKSADCINFMLGKIDLKVTSRQLIQILKKYVLIYVFRF